MGSISPANVAACFTYAQKWRKDGDSQPSGASTTKTTQVPNFKNYFGSGDSNKGKRNVENGRNANLGDFGVFWRCQSV